MDNSQPRSRQPYSSHVAFVVVWLVFVSLGSVIALLFGNWVLILLAATILASIYFLVSRSTFFRQSIAALEKDEALIFLRRAAPILTVVAVVWAAVSYGLEADDREQDRMNTAWAVITAAHGVGDAAGRREAIETLIERGVSLQTVDAAGGFLRKLEGARGVFRRGDLSSAFLDSAVFYRADVREVDFSRSDLRYTNYDSANLFAADFRGAQATQGSFRQTNLAHGLLTAADYRTADIGQRVYANVVRQFSEKSQVHAGRSLRFVLGQLLELRSDTFPPRPADFKFQALNADFSGAELYNARLDSAEVAFSSFRHSNLSSASLYAADFRFADLREANLCKAEGWESMQLFGANVANVRNPPPGFIDTAMQRGAVEIEDQDEWESYSKEVRKTPVTAPTGQIAMPRAAYKILAVNCLPVMQRRDQLDASQAGGRCIYLSTSDSIRARPVLDSAKIPGRRVPVGPRELEENEAGPCS